MIVYFSGTGNSRHLALELARLTDDEAVFITPDMHLDCDKIVFVFPIYAWGVPPYVVKCIQGMTCAVAHPVTFMAATCGDDIGYAAKEFIKLMQAKNWDVSGVYTLVMPDNYVFLPGFDVDKDDLRERKLGQMPQRIAYIAERINSVPSKPDYDVVEGRFPWIKSHWLKLWFHHRAMNPRRFRTTDACVACGRCIKECPIGNMSMGADKKVVWGDNCAFCLRCYHTCPHHAIDYNNRTRHKGQYLFKEK